LFKLDTRAILLAVEYGVHPITGCPWDMEHKYNPRDIPHRERDLVKLIMRNKRTVEELELLL
jgi:hypothetical protein